MKVSLFTRIVAWFLFTFFAVVGTAGLAIIIAQIAITGEGNIALGLGVGHAYALAFGIYTMLVEFHR